MKKKILKTFLIFTIAPILLLVSYQIVESMIARNILNERIKTLTKDAEFVGYSKYYDLNFYKSKYTSFDTPSFQINDGILKIGSDGDVLVSTHFTFDIPILEDIASYLFCAHAVMVVDNGMHTFETNGNDPIQNGSVNRNNYWLSSHGRGEFVGVKVNTSKSIKNDVCDISNEHLNIPYNYTFIFKSKNAYYCSDLIAHVYEEKGVFLDKNDIIISPLDLTCSSEVSIFCYKEKNKDVNSLHPGSYNFYYVDDGNDYTSLF